MTAAERSDPHTFLPLREVELQLLIALAEAELHGYGLVQAIARQTEGVVRLEPGNLYRVIRRLLNDALVEEAPRRASEESADERRRYYRVTVLGERVLAAELSRLHALVTSPATRALRRRLST